LPSFSTSSALWSDHQRYARYSIAHHQAIQLLVHDEKYGVREEHQALTSLFEYPLFISLLRLTSYKRQSVILKIGIAQGNANQPLSNIGRIHSHIYYRQIYSLEHKFWRVVRNILISVVTTQSYSDAVASPLMSTGLKVPTVYESTVNKN
jgi:hypothetical protein